MKVDFNPVEGGPLELGLDAENAEDRVIIERLKKSDCIHSHWGASGPESLGVTIRLKPWVPKPVVIPRFSRYKQPDSMYFCLETNEML